MKGNRDNTNDTLLAIVRAGLNLHDITIDSALGTTRGWDSLRQIKLVLHLEKTLGVSIPDHDIPNITSVRSLQEYLKGRELNTLTGAS